MTHILRNGVLAFLFTATLVAGGGYLWLRTSLPQTTGTINLAGLQRDVEIMRDEQGIPHIFAATETDSAFALGFVHAQDRLWQMEFTRRIGAGRLSEIIGHETVETDRFLRTLGLYRLAEQQAAQLIGGPKRVIDAYVDGVNAYIENHHGTWPLEFVLLGFEPEAWKNADSLVWAKLMGMRLSNGWRGDLLRANLIGKVGTKGLRRLFPQVSLDEGEKITSFGGLQLNELAQQVPEVLNANSASNAWILSGDRTSSGKPILANDPHLAFASPGLWYLARLTVAGRTRTGATVPGVPLLILGQNDNVAWGITSAGADTTDLFIETVVDADPSQYLAPTGPTKFKTRTETIIVKNDEPVTITIRESRHGPILSDVMPRFKSIASPNKVVALAATIFNPNNTTVEGLYRLNQANSLTAFREAATYIDAPLQNLFAADSDGNIGFIAAGHMPIRNSGHGHLPSSSQDGDGDWHGYVGSEHWPQTWNPPRGLIANANNRLWPNMDSPMFQYAWYWPASHRVARIYEYFNKAVAYDVEDSILLQMDNRSIAAKGLVPLLTKIEPKSGIARKAIKLVRAWDFEMKRNNPEPLIYAAWIRNLMLSLVADELGDQFIGYRHPRPLFIQRVLSQDTDWCDDISTAEKESCASCIEQALNRTLAELSERFGNEPKDWRWGDVHAAAFPHQILRHIPLLADWSEGRIETDGGDHTLNRGQTGGGTENPYRHAHGAGYRAVYDLSDPGNSRYSLATGQSGNPLSSQYMDQLIRWRDGRYFRIFGSRYELKARGSDILLLRPLTDKTKQSERMTVTPKSIRTAVATIQD
jgi:penicillin amidase